MSMKVNKKTYLKMIDEDLAWLDKQPEGLERGHIRSIIQESVKYHYSDGPRPKKELAQDYNKLHNRLQEGHHYLMGVKSDEITVEDALEAFGFGRNGLKG